MTDLTQGSSQPFELNKERVSTQCVCCGSERLESSPAVLMPFVAHRTFGWAPVVIDESWGLMTINKGHAYSICKSMYCAACGFLFLDIRFSDRELSNLYHDYRGEAYNALRESYEPGYSLRNANLNAGIDYLGDVEGFLAPHLRLPVTLLDWGGDTGKNSPFKHRNTAFDIFDISNKDVIEGARIVNKAQAQAATYDLVVCSNVLEHVPYPSEVLLDITQTMNEASVLYIEVPFEEVMVAEQPDPHLRKRHWHEHINFFSEQSLRRLAENVGLEVIDLNKLKITTSEKSSVLFQLACKRA